MPIEKHHTIIIGGGVAGLSAGLHLAERGLRPLILEADPNYLGGRLAGGEIIEVDGYKFRLEHGMHGIWSQYRNFQAMLARHNLRPVFLPAEEEGWIYKRGNFLGHAKVGSAIRRSPFPPPFHYLALFFSPRFLWMLDLRDILTLPLGWMGLVMGVGIDPFAESQPMQGMMLSEMTKRWSPAIRAFFLGLARNGLSAHPNEVPLSGFLAFLRFYTLLRRDAWVFSYLPDDGGTKITEPLGAQIEALGGQTSLGTRVTKIVKEGDEWLVQWDAAGSQQAARSQYLIIATDSQNAKKLIEENLGADALFFPRALGNAVVRLWFDKKPRKGAEAGIFTGDFIVHNYFWLDRLYNPFRRWGRERGGSVLEAHIYGPDEVLAQPDAMLLAQAIQDVQSAFPALRGHRIYAHLQRNPASHTLPAVGEKGKHLGVTTPWENLFCAGDWVNDSAPAFFIERACLMGIKAANEVLAASGEEAFPILPYLPPEPFAAWIEYLMQRGRARRRGEK